MSGISATDRERLLREVEPTVKGILRRKTRTSLSPNDGRPENLAALDLYQDVVVELLQKLNTGELEDLANFQGYAAVVTYHAWSEHLRSRFPDWASLKNRLRRFLTHQAGYAVWESDGDMVCGYAGWQGQRQERADGTKISELRQNPRKIDPAAIPQKLMERMTATDWDRMVTGFFDYLGGPVELDDLSALAGTLFGVKNRREANLESDREDEQDLAATLAADNVSADRASAVLQGLRRLWSELEGMRREWLLPYLLNPPGTRKDERGELDVFPSNGIASVQKIGRLVALSAAQFKVLQEEAEAEIRLDALPDDEHRFAAIWNRLPLRDATIARLMGKTTQEVINLRMVAITNLAKKLADFRESGAKDKSANPQKKMGAS